MYKTKLYFPFLFILCFLISISDGFSQAVEGELIIDLANDMDRNDWFKQFQSELGKGTNIVVKKQLPTRPGIFLIQFNEHEFSSEDIINILERDPGVRGVQKNYKVQLRGITPDDALFGDQWQHFKIKTKDAWDAGTGGINYKGDSIVIAVIDAGCDIFHEDLQNNIFYNDQEVPDDGIDNDNNGYVDDFVGWHIANGDDNHSGNGHGTSVCGIAGAEGNNSIGVAGINWQVKMLIISGWDDTFDILAAYQYVLDMRQLYDSTNGEKGAYIVATNASFGIAWYDGGTPENHPTWCAFYDELGQHGILSSASTINEDFDIDEVGDVPSACSSDYIISVTNVKQNDELGVAGYGLNTIDIGAPGSDIFTTRSNDSYGAFGGTSGATPCVSGAIAWLHSLPSERFQQALSDDLTGTILTLKELILNTADPIEDLAGRSVSGGRLNLSSLLEAFVEIYGKPKESLSIEVKPNLVHSQVIVSFKTPDYFPYRIRIHNALGQLLYDDEIIPNRFEDNEIEIDVFKYSPGVYIATLIKGQIKSSAKFVKM